MKINNILNFKKILQDLDFYILYHFFISSKSDLFKTTKLI